MKYTLKDYWEANSSDERQKIVEWAFKQLSDKIKYCQCHSVDLINIDLSVGLCRDCGKPPIWDIRQETEQPSPISEDAIKEMVIGIFGKEAGEDKDIMYLYTDCFNTAVKDYIQNNYQQPVVDWEKVKNSDEYCCVECLELVIKEIKSQLQREIMKYRPKEDELRECKNCVHFTKDSNFLDYGHCQSKDFHNYINMITKIKYDFGCVFFKSQLQPKEEEVMKYEGRVWIDNNGIARCDECCNKDRPCDESHHRLRSECTFCDGTGKPKLINTNTK